METLTLNKFWTIMYKLNREGRITKWLAHLEWDNSENIFGKGGNFCFTRMLNKPNSWWKDLYYNFLIERSFLLKNSTFNFGLFSRFIGIFMVIPITSPKQVSLKPYNFMITFFAGQIHIKWWLCECSYVKATFHFTASWESYFGSVGWQNNDPQF